MSWLIDSIYSNPLLWIILILIVLCLIGLWELSSSYEYKEWEQD